MLKKFLILLFLSASFSAWAECDTLSSPLFSVQINRTDTACVRDTLHLPTDLSFVYEWENGSRNSFLEVTGADTVWVQITDTIRQCERRDTIAIHLRPIPQITKQNTDTTLCAIGDTLILNSARKGLFADSTLWISSLRNDLSETIRDSLLTIVFDTNKVSNYTYKYITRFIGQCTRGYENTIAYTVHDTVWVYFAKRPTLDLGVDTLLCPDGEGLTLDPLPDDFDPERHSFFWTNGNDEAEEATLLINEDNKGRWIVQAWNPSCNDTATNSVNIDFWPKAWTESQLLSDTSVCPNEVVILDASVPFPLTTYRWEHDTNNPNPIITVNTANTYTVTLTDSAGCQRKFTCSFTQSDCLPKIEMPNVFTPNGDGINDFFYPTTSEKLYNFNLHIYNRWGRPVFSFKGDPKDAKWDGKNGSSQAPEGVYFWTVKFEDWKGKKSHEQGTVTLFR
ncbi:MAG: gliding motility-associated C-terminal domain-containing protein [Bacteroidales bacterium]|jgi:gliding motility-associated-like protein|nr:gliding motility-associated C-terminal domain-containing protein [Bacteroidales bacterium]